MLDDDDDPLLRLGDLLFDLKMQPGLVATAIERHGVHTWDRYGRFKYYPPESPEAEKALDLLATHYSATINSQDPSAPHYDWEHFYDMGGNAYCWPSSKAPKFEAIEQETSQVPAPPPRLNGGEVKSANAHAGIILGLLRFIKGELPGTTAHADFVSEAQLRALLDAHMVGYPGCSADNTKRKFKHANDLLAKQDYQGT